MKLSAEDDSSSSDDAVIKVSPLTPDGRWQYMYAGDSSRATFLHRYLLEEIARGANPTHPPTLKEMRLAVKSARDRLWADIGNEALAFLLITVETFFDVGKDKIPEPEYSQMFLELQALSDNIGVELLIAGFDDTDTPQLLKIDLAGHATIASHGFEAIGTGAALAKAAMYSRGSLMFTDVAELAYALLEAKFVAQAAGGVGEATAMWTFGPSFMERAVNDEAIKEARQVWIKRRQQPLPQVVRDILAGCVEPKPRSY